MSTSAPAPTADPSAQAAVDPAQALASRLFDAARGGSEDDNALLQQALEAGIPAAMANDKGDSLLMLAAYHGHMATAKLLLSHKADPNTLNIKQQSILAGVVFKDNYEMAELLLDEGADPELGEPSAREALGVFGKGKGWKRLFERYARK